MEKIAQFYKVSEEQFINDWRAATGSSIEEAKSVYANIRLPQATISSRPRASRSSRTRRSLFRPVSAS